MKTCTKCNKSKTLIEFRNKASSKDGKQSQCKNCRKILDTAYYKTMCNDSKSSKSKLQKIRKDRNAEYVLNYLQDHPCIDCGENDPIVLEFDHIEDKFKGIATMISGASIESIDQEISKCEIRCANCHRRKTAKQFNYYRATRINDGAPAFQVGIDSV